MMTNKTNYNVKIFAGKRTLFEVCVYSTSVNDAQQIINGINYNSKQITIRIQKAIEEEFKND